MDIEVWECCECKEEQTGNPCTCVQTTSGKRCTCASCMEDILRRLYKKFDLSSDKLEDTINKLYDLEMRDSGDE